jgi:hypothetical protein
MDLKQINLEKFKSNLLQLTNARALLNQFRFAFRSMGDKIHTFLMGF